MLHSVLKVLSSIISNIDEYYLAKYTLLFRLWNGLASHPVQVKPYYPKEAKSTTTIATDREVAEQCEQC